MEGDKIVVDAVASVAKEAYTDLIHPAAQHIGNSLGTLTGLFDNVVLSPLKKLNIKYEQRILDFKKEVGRKYDEIPEERRVDPQIHIVGPALESLKYNIFEDTLAELFSNLLVSDMDSKTQSLCTPSFVDVIRHLSPNDAKTFQFIYDNYYSKTGCPVCEIDLFTDDGKNYVIYEDRAPRYFIDADISTLNIYDVSKSIQNLSRVGLLDVSYDHSFKDETIYQMICQSERVADLISRTKKCCKESVTPKIVLEGIIHLNSFSIDFAKVCLRSEKW